MASLASLSSSLSKKVRLERVACISQDDPHKTMDGPATRTEKKGRDKAKSHGTPYSAKHARLAAATAAAATKKEPTKKGKEKK